MMAKVGIGLGGCSWVFKQAAIPGKKVNLTDFINEKHENPKYLPDVTLPENIIADPSAANACKGVDIAIFCLPHQFVPKVS